ncbi:MAG: DUF1850 domain-containing protein [Betaproteobacteria bacterium]|nr:DUF1850 domain-containing protein [Betaproteobacteria bacterium]
MSGLCLAAGLLSASLATSSFTLAWTHSVEKTAWEEDWAVEGHRLVLREARVHGSGAGMEPPSGARLEAGVWHYRPAVPAQPRLRLAHSPHVPPHLLCVQGRCATLAQHLPGLDNTAVVELFPCP